jgi:hypothetical protein
MRINEIAVVVKRQQFFSEQLADIYKLINEKELIKSKFGILSILDNFNLKKG